MRRKFLACLLLCVFSISCVPSQTTMTPVTWRQDEDEIILYVDLSSDASAQLLEMLKEPVSFDQISEFMVQNTNGKIPFIEGAMTAALLTARQDQIDAEMQKKVSEEGIILEIIGFKENPVKIMKGALDLQEAPKYLADFESQKNAAVLDTVLDLMSGDTFVVHVSGRFTE